DDGSGERASPRLVHPRDRSATGPEATLVGEQVRGAVEPLTVRAHERASARGALLRDPGGLAATAAQIVQLRAADPPTAHHLDAAHRRCVQREDPLDADPAR